LPVSKWLVAKEPIPLPIPGITDAVVCVEGVGGVICVQAAKISGIQIAVIRAAWITGSAVASLMRFGRRLTAWEKAIFDPIRITSQGLLNTCRCYCARSRDRVLDSVTELEEVAVACVEVAVLL
jgi:hypothetical protein